MRKRDVQRKRKRNHHTQQVNVFSIHAFVDNDGSSHMPRYARDSGGRWRSRIDGMAHTEIIKTTKIDCHTCAAMRKRWLCLDHGIGCVEAIFFCSNKKKWIPDVVRVNYIVRCTQCELLKLIFIPFFLSRFFPVVCRAESRRLWLRDGFSLFASKNICIAWSSSALNKNGNNARGKHSSECVSEKGREMGRKSGRGRERHERHDAKERRKLKEWGTLRKKWMSIDNWILLPLIHYYDYFMEPWEC